MDDHPNKFRTPRSFRSQKSNFSQKKDDKYYDNLLLKYSNYTNTRKKIVNSSRRKFIDDEIVDTDLISAIFDTPKVKILESHIDIEKQKFEDELSKKRKPKLTKSQQNRLFMRLSSPKIKSTSENQQTNKTVTKRSYNGLEYNKDFINSRFIGIEKIISLTQLELILRYFSIIDQCVSEKPLIEQNIFPLCQVANSENEISFDSEKLKDVLLQAFVNSSENSFWREISNCIKYARMNGKKKTYISPVTPEISKIDSSFRSKSNELNNSNVFDDNDDSISVSSKEDLPKQENENAKQLKFKFSDNLIDTQTNDNELQLRKEKVVKNKKELINKKKLNDNKKNEKEQITNKEEQPNYEEEQLNYEEEQPNFEEEEQQNYEEEQPNNEEQQQNYEEEQPNYEEEQPNYEEEQQNCEEEPNNEEEQQNYEEEQPNNEEEQQNYDEQPNYEEGQPNYEEEQPNYEEEQPNYEEEPNNEEEQQNYDEQPNYEEEHQNYEEEQPNYEEEQPNYEEEQPNYEEEQPNYEEEQPNNEEEQQNYEEENNIVDNANNEEQITIGRNLFNDGKDHICNKEINLDSKLNDGEEQVSTSENVNADNKIQSTKEWKHELYYEEDYNSYSEIESNPVQERDLHLIAKDLSNNQNDDFISYDSFGYDDYKETKTEEKTQKKKKVVPVKPKDNSNNPKIDDHIKSKKKKPVGKENDNVQEKNDSTQRKNKALIQNNHSGKMINYAKTSPNQMKNKK
ncbi:hypothetical protein M9Y10_040718 [Tritrichomonas musculus]|uniref:Uncharacterized protein n=1 Tax=Tritrichomonas musculus TaxID=1915356 RepID=A0ABR2K465_9EUKA